LLPSPAALTVRAAGEYRLHRSPWALRISATTAQFLSSRPLTIRASPTDVSESQPSRRPSFSRHILDPADSPKARRTVESRQPLHEEMRFFVSSSRQGNSWPMKDRGDRTVVSTWPVPSGIVWS